ncbi:MAG: hypothetical protein ACI8V0_001356 [Pseudohongiellaceae bacterium]|jgi:hypothetical protein
MLRMALLMTGLSLCVGTLSAQPLDLPAYTPTAVIKLQATFLAAFPAAEAGQGAAADEEYFYAIVNSAIGKYQKNDGALAGQWLGSRGGLIEHLNSCYAQTDNLYCSNSNFPEVPMASSIEVFDTETMKPIFSMGLGVLEEGSLTWFDHLGDGWIAGFAHYDERGGLAYKDHSYASIVRYDSQWRRQGGWMIPESVIDRMKPYAASGGALGPDGLLYLTGHDLREMYVLAAPFLGPKLIHIATIDINIEGQAFAFDKSIDEPVVYGISRPNREVRTFRLPEVPIPDNVQPLTALFFELP